MLRQGLMILTIPLLTACMSQAERVAAEKAEVDQMIRIYGPACDKLGYTRETDPWRDCILRLRAHDDERYRTRPTTTTCVGHRGFYNCTSF
ncbi:MAG: hypothetical protein HZB95_05215 [Nitrosomonadales bacterium]|nr:hypothetical protein [Nitrosomonadales bacterium]